MFDGCKPSKCKSALKRMLGSKSAAAKAPSAAPMQAPTETLEELTAQVAGDDVPKPTEAETDAGRTHTWTPVLRYALEVA